MLRAQRGVEGQRVDAVVLDGVRQPQHLGALQARHGGVDHALHVLGHGRGHSLHIPFVGVQPLGLHEDGMALLVAEADDLVLDGRAVARAGAVDGAGVHGRAVQVVENDPVGLGGGVGQIAQRAVLQRLRVGHERKRRHRLVAALGLHLGKVDGAAVQARGRAGLEPADGKAQVDQVLRQRVGGHQALGAAVPRAFADDDAAVQVHTAGDHDGPAADGRARGGAHAGHPAIFHQNALHLGLAQVQPLAVVHRPAHAALVLLLVRLCPQRVHRRALAGVQHARLDEHVVDGAAHLAAQRVQLPH